MALLLLPVELTKKKGVKDHYTLEPAGTEAEVNPALRHHLKQLYNLDLPETVDLRATDADESEAAVKAKLAGRADMTRVSGLVKARLTS